MAQPDKAAILAMDVATAVVTRRFDLKDGDSVELFVWAPTTSEDDWAYCPWRIRGLSHGDPTGCGRGVDSVATLQSALTKAAMHLYTSSEYRDGRLTWRKTRDLGLPLLPGMVPGEDGYADARLLTLVGPCSVVVMPDVRFPYVAWPGDRLEETLTRLRAAVDGASDNAALREKLERLVTEFADDQDHYERVCAHEGFDISYVKAAG